MERFSGEEEAMKSMGKNNVGFVDGEFLILMAIAGLLLSIFGPLVSVLTGRNGIGILVGLALSLLLAFPIDKQIRRIESKPKRIAVRCLTCTIILGFGICCHSFYGRFIAYIGTGVITVFMVLLSVLCLVEIIGSSICRVQDRRKRLNVES
jgi:hypothetical protein